MPPQEVPVEGIEGAGVFAGAGLRVIEAASAVVPHALDVSGRADVGFGGHEAAVGPLAHAEGIWGGHPLKAIHEKP